MNVKIIKGKIMANHLSFSVQDLLNAAVKGKK